MKSKNKWTLLIMEQKFEGDKTKIKLQGIKIKQNKWRTLMLATQNTLLYCICITKRLSYDVLYYFIY